MVVRDCFLVLDGRQQDYITIPSSGSRRQMTAISRTARPQNHTDIKGACRLNTGRQEGGSEETPQTLPYPSAQVIDFRHGYVDFESSFSCVATGQARPYGKIGSRIAVILVALAYSPCRSLAICKR